MPAGFTADGLPVGVELLGGAFTEADLLGYAYAWEQAAHPRRPPFSTPPLVDGRAPAPSTLAVTVGAASDGAAAAVRLVYQATTGALEFDVAASGSVAIVALALHRPEGDQIGPIVAHLLRGGARTGKGTLTLRGRDRADFVAGRTSLRLYSARQPLGSTPIRVALP
jgi:hypothetical protein